MAKNLFVEYIEISKKNIYKYLKFIFKNKYDNEIAKIYVDTYVNSRYYNLSYQESHRVFYLRVKETLAKKMNQLLVENEKTKERTQDYVTYRRREKIIQDMFTCFDYIYFFDKLRNVENMTKITTIEEVVDRLYQKREKDYDINERQSSKEKFLELVNEGMLEAETFLDRYFMDNSFELQLKKYNDKHNLYSIELISNLKIPMIYSSAATRMAYNSTTIKEERLEAEYALLSLLVARDIVESNFKDQYLVEFIPSIMKKKTKFKQTIELINDPALQEKINLKIKYEQLLKCKQEIFELIKQGYKFALILDHDFEDIKEIEKLQMFSYIIVGNHLRCASKIAKSYKKSDKIIFE